MSKQPSERHDTEVKCTRKCHTCKTTMRAWENPPDKCLPFMLWCPACKSWYDATSPTTESPNITGGDLQP